MAETWKPSEVCFRVCGTCVVLAATLGVTGCVVKEAGIASFALIFVAGAVLALVVGIIAAIWDQ